MKLTKLASVLCVLLVICTGSTFSATTGGRIAGVIVDANNARVVNAAVTIRNGDLLRRVKSNEQGEFEVSLPAGNYHLIVEADGFLRFSYSPLAVKVDETKRFDVHLKVAPPRGLIPAWR